MDLSDLSELERRAFDQAESSASMLYELVEIRRASGLTRAEVGKRMGISKASVAKFEAYYNDPKLSTIKRYALAVGATVTFKTEIAPDAHP